jgi:UDP-N-acetylmuramoylalanine--D-glutamate ligase
VALCPAAELSLRGVHNLQNSLAAAAAACFLGVPPASAAQSLRSFAGVPHRLQVAGVVGGVTYVNDSKATNVDAARRSLEAFDRPVLVVLGGRYKGGDFTDLAPALRHHGRRVLAIGEARERLRAALAGVVPVDESASLEEAGARARAAARPGDVVLLAPACSSFDMFADYAARGRAFQAEVRRLAEAGRG